MHIDGKEQGIGQKRKSAYMRDHFIIMHEVIQEFPERQRRETDPVNNNQANQRTDQAKDQTQSEIVFGEEHAAVF